MKINGKLHAPIKFTFGESTTGNHWEGELAP